MYELQSSMFPRTSRDLRFGILAMNRMIYFHVSFCLTYRMSKVLTSRYSFNLLKGGRVLQSISSFVHLQTVHKIPPSENPMNKNSRNTPAFIFNVYWSSFSEKLIVLSVNPPAKPPSVFYGFCFIRLVKCRHVYQL